MRGSLMNNRQILKLLSTLKLYGATTIYEQQIASSTLDELTFDERFFELLNGQNDFVVEKRKCTLNKQAKLRYPTMFLENLDYGLYPDLKQKQVQQLITCDWIREHRHLLITGKTGTGKTSLACIFAQEAIKQLIPVLFFRLTNLLLELVVAQKEEKLKNYIRKLNRAPLIIIDDWGNALMNKPERHLLFELIESRDLNASLLITSQYPVSVWHESFQDSTIADSVLDRIVHNAHQIEFKKGSIRRMLNEKREK
jgi:DNA replication protein DnaC